ncbi:dCTP deaminase [Streptomyces sp. RP5T]|uniref:dCTP deaminase n=1 Tax=Streptomyces sp. RP5T TaxID=2490848 RepID=UPI000F64B80F|nr:dCTP deaminase [Streptomyces sp. RP5T]RRR85977.1 dCTP deaminase [Streptomyces sp. RP5T]
MILTGPEIHHRVTTKEIDIDPFDPGHLSPNSYDLHLGTSIGWYTRRDLDCARDNPFEHHTIPAEGLVLSPGRIYLASTAERVGSDVFVPIIRARSSMARLGLFVHVTADLIDIGSHGHLTLQLHAVQPVRIYPRLRVAQVTFWQVKGDIELYCGKYQATGELPMPSQLHRDFRGR